MHTDKIKTEVYRFLNRVFVAGREVQGIHSGTTAQRPTTMPNGSALTVGYQYFDTTIGRDIRWNGSSWVYYVAPFRTERSTTVTNSTFLASDTDKYVILNAVNPGTWTINVNTFAVGTELLGENRGAPKTLVAGTNGTDTVNIRIQPGGSNVIDTNQKFSIKYIATNDVLVTLLGSAPRVLTASPTLDFPVIASGASATLTTTVTGASLLNNVNVAGSADIYAAGGRIDAWVSLSDTVTVRIKNDGGSSIDPASGTFNIKVFK